MLWKLAVYWSYELQIFSPVFLKFWLFFSYMEYLYLYKIKFCFCCCSAPKSCPNFCDHMDCNMPGFPVLHCLPESAQIHVHWVSDSIQPPHPLPLSSPFAFNLSQYQDLFQWVGSSHQVAKLLALQLQSFQWIFRVYFLWDWLVGSLWSPRDSQESSPAPQFKSISSLGLSFLYGPTLTSVHDYWNNHIFDYVDLCQQSDISAF